MSIQSDARLWISDDDMYRILTDALADGVFNSLQVYGIERDGDGFSIELSAYRSEVQ